MIITVFTRDSASGILSNVQFPDRIISVLRERGKEEAGGGGGGTEAGVCTVQCTLTLWLLT